MMIFDNPGHHSHGMGTLDLGIDWNPTHSSLASALSKIDWNPGHSEAFRNVIMPTLEIAGIAAITVATAGGGTLLAGAGMAASAAVTVGSAYAEKQMGYTPTTGYAQLAPVIGALVGAGISIYNASQMAAELSGGLPAPASDALGVPGSSGILDTGQSLYDTGKTIGMAAAPVLATDQKVMDIYNKYANPAPAPAPKPAAPAPQPQIVNIYTTPSGSAASSGQAAGAAGAAASSNGWAWGLLALAVLI
jgi:hypothetical protein